MDRTQAGNVVGALRVYGTPQAGDDSPNPVLGSLPYKGGTIRVYRDGMLDAVDGSFYSLSPGFSDLDELLDWIASGGTTSPCEGHPDGPVMGETFYCNGTCRYSEASAV